MTEESSVRAYMRGLEAMEKHDRPDDYPGLTEDNRKKAGLRHLEIFAQTSWPMWRTYKIHLMNRLLDSREMISKDVKELFPDIKDRADTVTYQEVTNGIMGSVMAEYCQCVEDLAALTNAIVDIRYFARNLSYRAGRIQNIIKGWANGISLNDFRELFFVPELAKSVFDGNEEGFESYTSNIKKATEDIKAISHLYLTLLPHQIAYKHGMSYALRPYGNDLDAESIEKKKTDKSGFPTIFSNDDIPQALREFNFRGVLQFPDAEYDHIRLNATKLAEERNLLRLVIPPYDSEGNLPSCDYLEAMSKHTCRLLQVAIRNCLSYHKKDPGSRTFHSFDLPLPNGRLMNFSPE